jgi:hypothetical protein
MSKDPFVAHLRHAVTISRRTSLSIEPEYRIQVAHVADTLEGILQATKNRAAGIRQPDYVPPVRIALKVIQDLPRTKDTDKLGLALQTTLDWMKE